MDVIWARNTHQGREKIFGLVRGRAGRREEKEETSFGAEAGLSTAH